MCGLVGVAGVLTQLDVKVFNEMLYHDYVRGQDSTGVGAVHEHTGEIRLIKGAYDPVGLMSFKGYDTVVNSTTKVLMGHNRAATRGKVNRHNAHPFSTGRILGAHNGTLDWAATRALPAATEGDTDSEQIINAIHDNNGNVAETIPTLEGAWALTIYDKDTNILSFVRNEKRPLFYTFSESKRTIYWSSEIGLLVWVLERHGIKRGNVYDLSVNTVLSWQIPKASETFGKAGREAAEGKKPVNFHRGPATHNSEAPWEQWGTDLRSQRSAADKSGTQPKRTSEHRNGPLDSDTTWTIYMEGYTAGETPGVHKYENPYHYTHAREEFDTWSGAFDDAVQRGVEDRKKLAIETRERAEAEAVEADWASNDPNKPKTAAQLRREAAVARGNAAREASGGKPEETPDTLGLAAEKVAAALVAAESSKVIQLSDHSAGKKLPPATRLGPNGKQLTKAAFRSLTNHECGWCENPVDFDDKGMFMHSHSYGTIYVCEPCVKQPSADLQSFEMKNTNG